MKLHPRVTRAGVELVKRFEGLRRRAAQLPDGGWTVGYGHTRSAREGAVVSPEDAEALLYYDLSEVAEKVEAWTFSPLNQNQFEALTAFAFNIGIENFRRSTVLKRVNEGHHLLAASAFELWRKADFQGEDLVIDALVRRRAAEKAHYLTPPEGFRPSPTQVLRPTYDHSIIEVAAQMKAAMAAAEVVAPLDGDLATAHREDAPEPEAHAETVIAPAAATVAAAAVSSRLHQLFPDRAEETAQPAAQAMHPAQEPGLAEATPLFSGSGPQVEELADAPAVEEAPVEATDPLAAPPFPVIAPVAPPLGVPPHSAAPFSSGRFRGFEPPPRRFTGSSLLAPEPANERWPEPPPFAPAAASGLGAVDFVERPAPFAPPVAPHGYGEVSAESADPQPGLFNRPTPFGSRISRLPGGDEPAFTAERQTPNPPLFEAPGMAASAEVLPAATGAPMGLAPRTIVYFVIGLIGVALFAAAVFSMFAGKASVLNLATGIVGIILVAPAGGYFLVKMLERRGGEAA